MRSVSVRSLLLLSLCLLLCCAAPLAALAAEPPTAPMLRIEAGAHTAPILGITTDPSGQLALTTSEDKTARLFDIKSGKLLRIFRPPILGGNEVHLYKGILQCLA